MHDNEKNQQFTLTDRERQVLPDVGSEWSYDESTELLDLINERIAGIVGSAVLTTFPHGSQRETMRRRIESDLGTLTSARAQLLPHILENGLSDEDLQRFIDGE